MRTLGSYVLFSVVLVSVIPILSCGGAQPIPNSDPVAPKAEISLLLSPATAEIDTTLHSPSTVQFSASVSNTSDAGVVWKVNSTSGGNSDVGTISNSGLYTAPLFIPATAITVTAVSKADPSKSVSATVKLRWAVEVALSLPEGFTVPLNGEIPINYSVDTNAPDKEMDWFVNWATGGDIEFGTIRAEPPSRVWYEAPAMTPSSTIDVRAVARANPSKDATVRVSLLSAKFVVLPMAAKLGRGEETQFKAYLDGVEVPAVWTLNGTGMIANGLYTAPSDGTTSNSIAIIGRYNDHFATSLVTISPEESEPSSCVSGRYAVEFAFGGDRVFLGTISFDDHGEFNGIGDLYAGGFSDEPSYEQLRGQTFAGTYSCTPEGQAVLKIALQDRKPFPVVNLAVHASMVSGGLAYLSGDARGSMEQQVNAPYSNELMAGTFVLRLDGGYSYRCLGFCLATGYPITMLGVLQAQSSGTITGSMDYVAPSSQQVSLDGSMFSIDSSGRGTATLQFGQNDSHLFGGTFSTVAVSPDKWLYMYWSQVGPEPFMLRGAAERQASLDSMSFQKPFVFQAGARTGRFVVTEDSATLTGTLDQVLDGAVEEDVPFSSALSGEPNGRGTGSLTIAGEQSTKLLSYFIRPEKWLLAIGSSLGQAEAQSDMPFSSDLIEGAYVVHYKGADGWFSRQPSDDGFGSIEHGPHVRYLRAAFSSASQEGKGTIEFSESGADGPSVETTKYYAVSASKLLFTNFEGFTQRSH